MNISSKSGLRIVLFAVATVALSSTSLVPAQAETVSETQHDIPFSSLHPCTLENTTGDSTVHSTITVTTGDDGIKQVHMLQSTHGTQLVGEVSGDTYNFNNAEDYHEHFQVGASGGHIFTRTEYIHTTEGVANLDQPGLDDFHQRIYIFIDANGVPTVTKTEADCR
ncbi:MAG: hypothetical protein M3280_04315 [Actinomycetota bacterium]|nr:hypothetical protein [Actinomycetota bacterium]